MAALAHLAAGMATRPDSDLAEELPYNTKSSAARLFVLVASSVACYAAAVPPGAVMFVLLAADVYFVGALHASERGSAAEAKILLRARWPAVLTFFLGLPYLVLVATSRVFPAHAPSLATTLAALVFAGIIMGRMPDVESGAVINASLFKLDAKPPALLQMRDGNPVGASGVLWLRSTGITDAMWHVGGAIPSYERVWAK
ncbi:hypothetical protein Q8F55_005331 [Vanrija albida]|uniref:Uncharacterized protein n=1 Tax=Vanrija albida TaxID=181172 RepID=A0ABR3Q1C2_9TREE